MVQKFDTLADCIRLAEMAHFKQTDKAGEPYINHPKRVLRAVQERGERPFVQMGAILHDVTEDTAYTCQMLVELGVPTAAVEIVRLLDRGHSERLFNELNPQWANVARANPDYKDARDAFYYAEIRKNPGAKVVKNEDIDDNLKEWRLSYLPAKDQIRLRDEKYPKAKRLLNGEPERVVIRETRCFS